jgi:hypothetical protein
MASSATVRTVAIAITVLYLAWCVAGTTERLPLLSLAEDPGAPSEGTKNSAGLERPEPSRTMNTHQSLPLQPLISPSRGPDPVTEVEAGTAWQLQAAAWQRQELSTIVASKEDAISMSHPTFALTRRLLQGREQDLDSRPGSPTDSTTSASSSSNSTSGAFNQTEEAASSTSSTGSIVVLSVSVPSNVKTLQILVTNGVPGSNVTSLSIDSSSSSNVTLSLASPAKAHDIAKASVPQNTDYSRSYWLDVLRSGWFWLFVFCILACVGMCVPDPFGDHALQPGSRLQAVPRAPVIGTPSHTTMDVQLEVVQREGGNGNRQCAGSATQPL